METHATDCSGGRSRQCVHDYAHPDRLVRGIPLSTTDQGQKTSRSTGRTSDTALAMIDVTCPSTRVGSAEQLTASRAGCASSTKLAAKSPRFCDRQEAGTRHVEAPAAWRGGADGMELRPVGLAVRGPGAGPSARQMVFGSPATAAVRPRTGRTPAPWPLSLSFRSGNRRAAGADCCAPAARRHRRTHVKRLDRGPSRGRLAHS